MDASVSPGADSSRSGRGSDDLSVSVRSSLFEDDLDLSGSRGAEIDPIRGDAHDLREQLDAVRHEKRLLEVDYDRVERLARRQLVDMAQKHKAEIARLQRKASEATQEAEKMRKLLEARNVDYNALECPASLYEELRLKKEEDLSTKELILLRVFEMNAGHRARIAKVIEEADQAAERGREGVERATKAERALERLQAKYREDTTTLERELSDAKQQARENRDKFLESLKHDEGLHERAAKFTRLQEKCAELERERDTARRQAEAALEASNTAAERLAANEAQVRSTTEQMELLRVDKTYLSRERDDARAALLRLEQALDREKEKVVAVEKKLETVRDQFQNVRESAKSEMEQKFEQQVSELRASNAKQLADIKEGHLKAAETQLRHMTASRDQSIAEAEHARSLLASTQEELEEVKLELASRGATHQVALSEVRSQLNMRLFESETLATTLEEKSSLLRKMELQNEMLEAKLEVLKGDFAALETSNAKQIVELTAKVATQEERLGVYEALEHEVDNAIAQQRTPPPLPVAAERRVKHSVQLAERLLATERQLQTAIAECSEREAASLLLRKRLEEAEQAAAMKSQPHSYLMEKLKEKDDIINRLQVRLRHVQESLEGAIKTRDEIHADLKRALAMQDEQEPPGPRSPSASSQMLHKAQSRKSPSSRGRSVSPSKSPRASSLSPSSPRKVPVQLGSSRNRSRPAALSTATLRRDRGQDKWAPTSAREPSPPSVTRSQGETPSSAPPQVYITTVDSPGFSHDGDVLHEVDQPDVLDLLNTSMASADSSTFVLHRHDQSGLPLPRWYRKMRTPDQPSA